MAATTKNGYQHQTTTGCRQGYRPAPHTAMAHTCTQHQGTMPWRTSTQHITHSPQQSAPCRTADLADSSLYTNLEACTVLPQPRHQRSAAQLPAVPAHGCSSPTRCGQGTTAHLLIASALHKPSSCSTAAAQQRDARPNRPWLSKLHLSSMAPASAIVTRTRCWPPLSTALCSTAATGTSSQHCRTPGSTCSTNPAAQPPARQCTSSSAAAGPRPSFSQRRLLLHAGLAWLSCLPPGRSRPLPCTQPYSSCSSYVPCSASSCCPWHQPAPPGPCPGDRQAYLSSSAARSCPAAAPAPARCPRCRSPQPAT